MAIPGNSASKAICIASKCVRVLYLYTCVCSKRRGKCLRLFISLTVRVCYPDLSLQMGICDFSIVKDNGSFGINPVLRIYPKPIPYTGPINNCSATNYSFLTATCVCGIMFRRKRKLRSPNFRTEKLLCYEITKIAWDKKCKTINSHILSNGLELESRVIRTAFHTGNWGTHQNLVRVEMCRLISRSKELTELISRSYFHKSMPLPCKATLCLFFGLRVIGLRYCQAKSGVLHLGLAFSAAGDRYRVPKLRSLSIRNSLIIISSEIHY